MSALKIHDYLKKRVLVTRDSARQLRDEIQRLVEEGGGEIELNFVDVDGLTPSFLDELLNLLSEWVLKAGRIRISNTPTRLSSKFSAVGRSHGLALDEAEDGSWLLTPLVEREQ